MSRQQLGLRLLLPLLFGLNVTAFTGCSIERLDTRVGALLGDSRDAAPASEGAATEPGSPHYVVELRADGKKAVAMQMPLTEDTFIQQSLEKSGAIRRFRRMHVSVYRPLANGSTHKIKVNFDRGQRRVEPGSDYAIHPNDRIVVTEDTSNVFDDMLQSISGSSKTMIGH